MNAVPGNPYVRAHRAQQLRGMARSAIIGEQWKLAETLVKQCRALFKNHPFENRSNEQKLADNVLCLLRDPAPPASTSPESARHANHGRTDYA